MKRIYLDHAAATPVSVKVLRSMEQFWANDFENPSSLHKGGVRAGAAVTGARTLIAETLGAHADEIIFTGSATESCALALLGSVRAWEATHVGRTPHIIVSAIEHDAILSVCHALEKSGARVTIIPVDHMGIVNVDDIFSALTLDTVVVSIGYVNNEIGVIQPLSGVARILREWRKEVRGVTRDVRPRGDDCYPLLHTDACQATNYLALSVSELGVDLLTINAAKIYGPKGVALLYARRGVALLPIIAGGGQEGGRRAGTENVPFIVGFAEAFRDAVECRTSEVSRLSVLQNYAFDQLRTIPGVALNGHLSQRVQNNINISLRDADHEFVVIALDALGIAVSGKSACNEAGADESHVLRALCDGGHTGLPTGLRITMGRRTKKDDIDEFLRALLYVRTNLIVTLP